MKNLFWTLIFLAVCMNLAAPRIKGMLHAHDQWRVRLAVRQVQQAKKAFAEANAEVQNALDSYDAATPQERITALEDAGLLSDKTALFVADPGALDELPVAHTEAEMDRVGREARGSLGAALASL